MCKNMATISKPVGYECEFVDQVPEDYFCKQCKHVAREPNITSCCGEILCKACVENLSQNKGSCPSCEETNFSSYPHKKYQRMILLLKACCSLKNRGCEWTGQLQHLDAHLDLTTGDCVYVDVDCPKECNQKVQKRNVDTHLANHCPNRDYTCPHCSFKATFREVSEHFEVCRYYPLVCPNRCGASFERDVLEDHMKMCGMQELQCEFSYAGCRAEFIRDHQKEHMEQNTQKHLALVAAATLRISQTFEQKLQEQQQTIDEQKEDFRKQLAERDQLINTIKKRHGKIINNICLEIGIPPYEFTLTNYKEKKEKYSILESPPMFSHPGGYKFNLAIWPNGHQETIFPDHMTLKVYLHRGKNDTTLKFPAKFTITLELLNQHRDQDHHERSIQCEVTREKIGTHSSIGSDYHFVSIAALDWNKDNKTQYLKKNSLKLRVTKIVYM